MAIRDISKLSCQELRNLANQKNSKGNATRDAYLAQRELRERSNAWADIPRKTTYEATLMRECGTCE